MVKKDPGKVYLVGAGPGDPGLITIKGLEILKKADVVVHDYLANPRLLSEVKPGAELVFVGKRHDKHFLEQEEINRILIDKARTNDIVVRLKGGDPFIFGRGGEEAEALVDAGISYEIVPGVTSAVAVPAYAGIPLTHRDFASDVAFVTGYESPGKKVSDIEWDKLARGVGTLVFLMGITNIDKIAKNLIEHGRHACTPTAVIRWGTLAEQRVITGTLGDIAAKVSKYQIKPPALIVVGEVVRLHDKLEWFQKKPLSGRKILTTRPREQSGQLIKMLEDLGAEVLEFPTIQTIALSDYSILDKAIGEISDFDWIVFTSANGVAYFIERLLKKGKDVRALKDVKIAAVGPATARRVQSLNINIDLIPRDYVAEGLIEEFERLGVGGLKILLPRAVKAREALPDKLRSLGASVTVAPAYQTITAATAAAPVKKQLEQGRLDWITFTSASTVKNFVKIMGGEKNLINLLENVKIAVIGPVTAKAAMSAGFRIDAEAMKSTNGGLVEAIVESSIKEMARA